MSLQRHLLPASACPRCRVFFLRQTVLSRSCTASRTNWHREIPRLRAASLARPFVLCETRPEMTVGNVRPLGVGVALDGCELVACAAPDALSSERGCSLVSIMIKAGYKYTCVRWSRNADCCPLRGLDFMVFDGAAQLWRVWGRFRRLGGCWFRHVLGMGTKKGTPSGAIRWRASAWAIQASQPHRVGGVPGWLIRAYGTHVGACGRANQVVGGWLL